MSQWSKNYLHLCSKLNATETAKQQISRSIEDAKRIGDNSTCLELSIRLAEVAQEQKSIEQDLMHMRKHARRA